MTTILTFLFSIVFLFVCYHLVKSTKYYKTIKNLVKTKSNKVNEDIINANAFDLAYNQIDDETKSIKDDINACANLKTELIKHKEVIDESKSKLSNAESNYKELCLQLKQDKNNIGLQQKAINQKKIIKTLSKLIESQEKDTKELEDTIEKNIISLTCRATENNSNKIKLDLEKSRHSIITRANDIVDKNNSMSNDDYLTKIKDINTTNSTMLEIKNTVYNESNTTDEDLLSEVMEDCK